MNERSSKYVGRTPLYDSEKHRKMGWKIALVVAVILCMVLILMEGAT